MTQLHPAETPTRMELALSAGNDNGVEGSQGVDTYLRQRAERETLLFWGGSAALFFGAIVAAAVFGSDIEASFTEHTNEQVARWLTSSWAAVAAAAAPTYLFARWRYPKMTSAWHDHNRVSVENSSY